MEKSVIKVFVDTFRNRIAQGESVLLTIDALMPALSDKSKENELILLRARAKQVNSDLITGVSSQAEFMQHNIRHQAALLSFLDSLSPQHIHPNYLEDKEEPSSAHRSGQLFYRIPKLMKLGKPVRCSVRIALTKSELLNDLQAQDGDQLRDLQIVSDTMQVELADPYEEHFKIRARNSPEQAVFEKGYTEWHFMVTSMVAGEHPLELRVAVIALLNNKEVRREIILEETVSVTTEVSLQTIFPRPAWQEAETPALQFCASPAARPTGSFFYKVAQSGAIAAASVLLLFAALFHWPNQKDDDRGHAAVEPPTVDTVMIDEANPFDALDEEELAAETVPDLPSAEDIQDRVVVESQREATAPPIAPQPEPEMQAKEFFPEEEQIVIEQNELFQDFQEGDTPRMQLNSFPAVLDTGTFMEDGLAQLVIKHEGGEGLYSEGWEGDGATSGNDGYNAGYSGGHVEGDEGVVSTVLGFPWRLIVGRTSLKNPYQQTGKIAIRICVNDAGHVIYADFYAPNSTTADEYLIKSSLEAARMFLFEPSDVEKQCGLIEFEYFGF